MDDFVANDALVPPTLEELARIASMYKLGISSDDLVSFHEQAAASMAAYERIRELPEPKLPVRYPRTPGHRPHPDDNPLNAWAWRCSVQGAPDGPLSGRTIALKDNICVAGVPLSNGSAILEGFVPDVDATVVTRILDAGGEIIGKAAAEAFGLSAGSNTAATGAVLNPRNNRHATGGSSSGSAALVANGDCDMALGGDTGGSIRMPASLCGVYGMKATFGLVPYTGIFPIEHTLDHVGPLATSVRDLALLLETIAGSDGYDGRQGNAPEQLSYVDKLEGPVDELTIGVLEEGFGWPDSSHPEADDLVRDAIARLGKEGARVREVSVPLHRDGGSILAPLYAEGICGQLARGHGLGRGWKGYYPTSLQTAYANAWSHTASSLSPTGKLFILIGEYMLDRYHGRYYAAAQNLLRWLRDEYDAALGEVDILAMPTCAPEPVAMPHVENPSLLEVFQSGFSHHANAASFNGTGHPSLTVPCGDVDGLPVGLMLVGRHFEEATVLRCARALERSGT